MPVPVDPLRRLTFAAANILLALTYAMVGALLAPIFGRVGGMFLAFLLPFIDIDPARARCRTRSPAPWPDGCPATAAPARCSTVR